MANAALCRSFFLSAFSSVCVFGSAPVGAALCVAPKVEIFNPGTPFAYTVVRWGEKDFRYPDIKDIIPPYGGMLAFNWTSGMFEPDGKSVPLDRYCPYAPPENESPRGITVIFEQPAGVRITDWQQTVKGGLGSEGSSMVHGGNIQHYSPWSFHPLNELPFVSSRIPDLAPFQRSDLTIYTAVNLGVYLSDNPNGFAGDWINGQSLNDLGIHIVNGQAPGLNGIFWSTTDFTFDPDSSTGWVPIGGSSNLLNSDLYEAAFGEIGILASHAGDVPLPSTPSLVFLGIFGMLWRLTRRPLWQQSAHLQLQLRRAAIDV